MCIRDSSNSLINSDAQRFLVRKVFGEGKTRNKRAILNQIFYLFLSNGDKPTASNFTSGKSDFNFLPIGITRYQVGARTHISCSGTPSATFCFIISEI